MKYLFIFCCCLFFAISSYAQHHFNFRVNNFSKDKYAKVTIAQCNSSGFCDGAGKIAVYDKAADTLLIKVASDDLAFWLHDDKVKANIKQLPYGEQSVIMYEDYNFDGQKDFAIQDGQNSCYHGPSYRIYLAKEGRYLYSPSFSKLAHVYCGMFRVDSEENTLSTMTKDGCCRHQFVTFKVRDNEPQIIHSITMDQSDIPYITTTECKWVNGRMDTTITKEADLSEDGIKKIFSVKLQNGKKAVLFGINGRSLNYVLLNKKEQVEFCYPEPDTYDYGDINFELPPPGKDSLTVLFTNKDVHYTIYESKGKIPETGILVKIKGKTYDLKGLPKTQKGDLEELRGLHFDNMLAKSENVNPTGVYKWQFKAPYPRIREGYIKVKKVRAHQIAISLTEKIADNHFFTLSDTIAYQQKQAILNAGEPEQCPVSFRFTNNGVFVNEKIISSNKKCKPGIKNPIPGYFKKISAKEPENLTTLYKGEK